MELLPVLVLLVLAALGGFCLGLGLSSETGDESQAALRAEVAALRATLRLSTAAWQARQDMHDIARDNQRDREP